MALPALYVAIEIVDGDYRRITRLLWILVFK